MSRHSRYRPSPAMVVACFSLFVALGGVGYAAATIGSAQIENNSVKSTDIRNGTIVSKDISSKTRRSLRGQRGPAGATGATGAKGETGAAGTRGETGTTGAPGTAKAYANVLGESIDQQYTKGTWAVRRPDGIPTGTYCLDPPAGIDPETDPAIVTIEWSASSGSDLLAFWDKSNQTDCTDTEFSVRTYSFEGEPTESVPSNNVDFLITIP